MLDTYIKATAGTASYLLFIMLEFFEPVVKIVLRLFAIGGLFAFIVMLLVQPDHPFAKTAMFAMLGFGLIATALVTSWDILTTRMFYDRMYPDDEDDEEDGVSWWRTAINWLFVLALYAAFCVAAVWVYRFKPDGIEGLAVGFVWWVAAGVTLGVLRWMWRKVSGVPGVVADQLQTAGGRVRGWMKKNNPVRKNKAAEPTSNVVQLRRRG
jgi:hypothetical protein